eukprot:TRINITY_DN998_c0_g1_i1.p1 TRINITY_DN998_c0_g1~~TRINITY_DN998_c0_g1_i1.p1  ORF type:complete len:402 (-),score=98.01 TRINITY_DN998_c0_g1_i1:1082-2164(-)
MALVKRKEPETSSDGRELITASKKTKTDLVEITQRFSSLLAPIMELTGHQGHVYTTKFNPDGNLLASASFDKKIFIWNVYGECENTAVLEGHKNAVLDANWSPDGHAIYSASADKSVILWDVETASRLRKFTGHTAVVHCASMAPKETKNVTGNSYVFVSASDDQRLKLWDTRAKTCQKTITTKFPNTSVCFHTSGDSFFSGGVDNEIKYWELRKTSGPLASANPSTAFGLKNHGDTITGLAMNADGSYLLSNAMDSTVRTWDVRPFVEGSRNIKVYYGAQHHSGEKGLLRCSWSPDGSKIAAGSSDRFVTIWSTKTDEILYQLPGHKGTVNDVQFHPTEPIIASCGNDRTIYLGEIDPK